MFHMTPAPIVRPLAVSPRSVFWGTKRSDEEWAELAAGLRAYAAEFSRRSQESFDRCDTDGFLSQRALDMGAAEARVAAGLADDRGLSEVDALFDAETGELLPAKLINGRYGLVWGVLETADPSSRVVRWINYSSASSAKRRAAFYRSKGVTLGSVRVPARVTMSEGGWFANAIVVRTDNGFSANAEIVTRDLNVE